MIPIKDNIRHKRLPIITVSIIIVNFLVFLYQNTLSERELMYFIYRFGLIPALLFSGIQEISITNRFTPIVSSMFIHGSLLHVLSNNWYLWIFGDNVEDRIGHLRFILFYLTCGIFAGLIHAFLYSNSKIPMVGASGAISGVLGAYFILYPFSRIETLVFFFFFFRLISIPAFILLGLWFVYQFYAGINNLGSIGVPIAFWAHIGGFISGIFLLRYFLINKNRR